MEVTGNHIRHLSLLLSGATGLWAMPVSLAGSIAHWVRWASERNDRSRAWPADRHVDWFPALRVELGAGVHAFRAFLLRLVRVLGEFILSFILDPAGISGASHRKLHLIVPQGCEIASPNFPRPTVGHSQARG